MIFDSKEEEYFFWYLEELEKAGFIEDIIPQYPVITLSDKKEHEVFKQLKTKRKYYNKTLLQEHVYTPDFTVVWKLDAFALIAGFLETYNEHKTPFYCKVNPFEKTRMNPSSIIEVKPSFDQNNMTRAFILNQKWIYDKHKVFVQLIKPVDLFKQTFIPSRYIWTDGGTMRRKIKFKVRTLKEYLCKRMELIESSPE